MIRKSGWILCLLAVFLLVATVSRADEGWQTWKEGQVTKSAWTEGGQIKIEVDQVPYSFMPGAKIYKISRQKNGGFSQIPSNTNRIFKAQKVNMLIQGFRIYQLQVMQ